MSVLSDREGIASNELAFAVLDGFPVSPGHSLVCPIREAQTWFDAGLVGPKLWESDVLTWREFPGDLETQYARAFAAIKGFHP